MEEKNIFTDAEMIKTQQEIIDLLQSTKRNGIDKIIEYLKNSDFFAAPASTAYHLACEGGLAFHSLSVYKTLKEKIANNKTFGDITEESMIISALLHDVCKIGCYETFMRNVKDDNGVWRKEPQYRFVEQNPLGHGEKSVIALLMQGLELTEEEVYAIRWHMGAFTEGEHVDANFSIAVHKYPLVLALHEADAESSYLMEDILLENKDDKEQ